MTAIQLKAFTAILLTFVGSTSAFAPVSQVSRIISSNQSHSALKLGDSSNGDDALQTNKDTGNLQGYQNDRRDFISDLILSTGFMSAALGVQNAIAVEDDDLTSQMFNEDGSLKEGAVETIEAADRTITIAFPAASGSDTEALVSVDGADIATDSTSSPSIKSTFQVPVKWTASPEYIDTQSSDRKKACDRISVYQVPGTFKDFSTLEKAATIGVTKALGFKYLPDGVYPKTLLSADIVNGRKVTKAASTTNSDDGKDETRKYYEFDLAVAPTSCGSSAENLGLGFCPYDTIVLLSATIVDGKMMVCGVSATKDEWKQSNADIKRVRNSFFVESA